MITPFEPGRGYRLNPAVALRPEPFGFLSANAKRSRISEVIVNVGTLGQGKTKVEGMIAPPRMLVFAPRDFEGLVGQDRQRLVQTRRIHANLAGADPLKHERHPLDGRMDEVY